jgi:hypothetical protein
VSSITSDSGLQRGSPAFIAAALNGKIQGISRFRVRGRNPDIDIATAPADIWSGGGLIPVPAGPEPWEILSNNAADTNITGTGAWTVQLSLIDGNFVSSVQTVALNGTTPVALTGSFLFINSAYVVTAGTGFKNAGTLTIRRAGGATRALIDAGAGILNQGKFTVPAGFTAEVIVMQASMAITTAGPNSQFVDLCTVIRDRINQSEVQTLRQLLVATGSSMQILVSNMTPVLTLREKLQCTWRGLAVSSNTTVVYVDALVLLYQNTLWTSGPAPTVQSADW